MISLKKIQYLFSHGYVTRTTSLSVISKFNTPFCSYEHLKLELIDVNLMLSMYLPLNDETSNPTRIFQKKSIASVRNHKHFYLWIHVTLL